MSFDLHNAHLFASDIDVTVAWWCQHLGGKILFDGALSGSRNVFLAVGSGRLHIYDQPPRGQGRNAIHHLGIKVAHLKEVWQHLQSAGLTSPNGLRENGDWRYAMIAAPDGVLVELFEFDDPAAPVNLIGPQ